MSEPKDGLDVARVSQAIARNTPSFGGDSCGFAARSVAMPRDVKAKSMAWMLRAYLKQ
jgi:hypothetical protein